MPSAATAPLAGFHRLLRRGRLCWLILVLPVACRGGEGGAEAKAPARVVVEMAITPGKPGAPTESIRIASMNGVATVTSMRDSGAQGREEETATLPAAVFARFWREVTRSKAAAFVPKPAAGETFDFGVRRLSIDTRANAGAGDTGGAPKAIQWERPLANEDQVKPLFATGAKIAREHCKKIPLHYFP